MSLPTTTRRALLGSAPVAAAAVALPAVAVAAVPSNPRARWNAAMRAYLSAKAEAESFDATYDRIRARWKATQPTTDTIHWKRFPYEDRDNVARRMDTEERWTQFLQGEGRTWFAKDADANKSEMRAALDSVKAYREAVERHNRESGIDVTNERSEALGDRLHDADTALMNTPAPDLAALRWKIERFRDDDGDLDSWTDKFVRQTFVDLANLVPEAG